MPICGFNEQMLKGLEMFHKGLAEYKINKDAKKNNESLENN